MIQLQDELLQCIGFQTEPTDETMLHYDEVTATLENLQCVQKKGGLHLQLGQTHLS